MNTFYVGQYVVYHDDSGNDISAVVDSDPCLGHLMILTDKGERVFTNERWLRPETVIEAIKRTLWPPLRMRHASSERVYMPGDVVLLGETKLRVLGLSKSDREKGPGLVYECEIIGSGTKIDAAEFILRPYSHNKSALWRAYDFIVNQ